MDSIKPEISLPSEPQVRSSELVLRQREHKIRVELYNAACAYGEMMNSLKHDYDTTMKIAQRLEDAAVAFAEMLPHNDQAMRPEAKP